MMLSNDLDPAPQAGAAHGFVHEVLAARQQVVAAGAPDAVTRNLLLAGRHIRIVCGSALLASHFLPAFSHLPGSAAGAGAEPDLTVHVWSGSPAPLRFTPAAANVGACWDKGEGVRLSSGGEHAFFDPFSRWVNLVDDDHRLAGLWLEDESRIPYWVTASPLLYLLNSWLLRRDLVLCHGAAVGFPGGCALITGHGGAGKSTLALGTLTSDLRYLGDDYVLLDPNVAARASGGGPFVHAIYSSGKLALDAVRRSVPHLLETAHYYPQGDDEKVVVMLQDVMPHKPLVSAPLKAILTPRICGAERPGLYRLGVAEILKAMIPSTLVQLPGREQQRLTLLASASAAVPVYQFDLCPDTRVNVQFLSDFLGGATVEAPKRPRLLQAERHP